MLAHRLHNGNVDSVTADGLAKAVFSIENCSGLQVNLCLLGFVVAIFNLEQKMYSTDLPAVPSPTASAVAQQVFIPWVIYLLQKYWGCLEATCHKGIVKALNIMNKF